MNLKAELKSVDHLVETEQYMTALSRLEELATEYPSEPSIWRTRAHVNSQRGNAKAAVDDVSKAIGLCNTEPDYYYTRGILFFKIARYRDAVSDFTKVIKLCDLHQSNYYREGAHFFRADAYLRLKEYSKATADCEHVRDSFQTWTDALRTKEGILAECGR
jgi:tetratricopeptide (TPR) repeat protein